jgi:hypothetical protein
VARVEGLPLSAVRAAAAATRTGRTFLGWARFPVVAVSRSGGGYEVRLADLRYARPGRARFGAVAIRIPGAVSSSASSPLSPQESP